jgi:hypothetical protein
MAPGSTEGSPTDLDAHRHVAGTTVCTGTVAKTQPEREINSESSRQLRATVTAVGLPTAQLAHVLTRTEADYSACVGESTIFADFTLGSGDENLRTAAAAARACTVH